MGSAANTQYGATPFGPSFGGLHTTASTSVPQATHGGLPFTGFDVGLLGILGLILVVTGLAVRRTARTTL